MGPLEAALARDSFASVDRFVKEIATSVALEESLGGLMADGGDSLLSMDVIRMETLWKSIAQQKIKIHALDHLFSKLANNNHERVIMRILWGLDLLIEKQVFHPREVAHSLVCSDQLRVESAAFFRCAFKLLLKLIFFLDYKSNREVFNKSIEKSSQFMDSPADDRFNLRFIDPAVELIQLLLSREMCLMPAYFAMHELIRSFPVELSGSPHKAIQDSVASFMDSFARPARLLYSQIHQSIKPICGITPPTTPGFRLDSTNLLLTVVKGAMRYPDFLTSSQTPLLCFVLGQLRSTELVAGMLDPSTGKSKTRSIGLEKAIVDWIIELMEITESTDDRTWVRTTFEHLISVVITFMLSSTIRFSEIVVKLNTKLEGRKWTKSSHYVMWFVLNVTSGFIGKNMLTDFVPCLRLFDILFPDAEDPDRAVELQTLGCGKQTDRRQPDGTSDADVTLIPTKDNSDSEASRPGRGGDEENVTTNTKDTGMECDADSGDEVYLSSTSADESDDASSLAILPPTRHRTAASRRRHCRLMHLATSPVCLWQHVLRKSRTGHDHLPRVMPPALRPTEARISYRMRILLDVIVSTDPTGSISPVLAQLTWRQLFIILNAYSTDNEASQLIQHLVDMFWFNGEEDPGNPSTFSRLWPKLIENGSVFLPYGLVAHGRLRPLSHHLIRIMSIHLRMLVLHLLLQKFANLQYSDELTTPAVVETMCRIVACREVEPSNTGRILSLLPKLLPGNAGNQAATDTSEPKTASSSCNLLSTLLDTLGYRLVDTFLPEVKVQTIVTLVNLLRMWTSWSASETPIEDQSQIGKDGKLQSSSKNDATEIPVELFYMLEWTIVKLARCLQAPDCVIYGLSSAISPASLAQAQAAAQVAAAAAVSTTTTQTSVAPNLTVSCASGALTGTLGMASHPGAGRGFLSGCRLPVPPNCNAPPPSEVSPSVGSALSNAISGYPFLMTEYVELNRFIIFSLLQIYYAFDLDESSAMKNFLAEQIRTMCERCGRASLTDLPRLVSSRLPEFLVHLRQRASPNMSGPGCGFQAGELVDKRTNLSQLPHLVLEEFTQLCDGETTWSQIAARGNLFLCVLLRYVAAHGMLPKSAVNTLLRLPFGQLIVRVRTLCDYAVTCLTGSPSGDECMAQKCLPALCELCVGLRVVPLDRFLLVLLTHTNYQTSQMDAVHRIIVHLFTKCDRLSEAIAYLSSRFPTVPQDTAIPSVESIPLHPDPVSSRHWPDTVLRLHQLIPDQWVTEISGDNPGMSKSTSETGEVRSNPKLPVLYGHMLLRLLPILEAILAHFLETSLPLVQLIPFCHAISPLFRFHRRPLNMCYVLLREHWHLTPPELEAFLTRDIPGTNSMNDKRMMWLADRLRVQLIIYHVLKDHHRLSCSRTVKSLERTAEKEGTPITLLNQSLWSEVTSGVDACLKAFDIVRNKYPDVDGDPAVLHSAESDLQSILVSWYRSRNFLFDVSAMESLLVPIVLSTQKHGLYGHPAAWRPWHLEENVSVQAAGLYAAAVGLMSSFTSPSEFVTSLAEFLYPKINSVDLGEHLNVIGSLVAILPNAYHRVICQFAITLFTDPILTDSTLTDDWPEVNTNEVKNSSRWRLSVRKKTYRKLIGMETEETDNITSHIPPRVAVNFFEEILPAQNGVKENGIDYSESRTANTNFSVAREACMLKANLWHAVWSHTNTTQLTSLPSLFAERILPRLKNEAQLLMSFYLVSPLMGTLYAERHAERHAKLIDLTAELYRAVLQVDSHLAAIPDRSTHHPGEEVRANTEADASPPNNTGVPMVHADAIADLMYHIKYMYVGNGVLDQVRPILPNLRPCLRKRLKFILPPSESVVTQLQQQQTSSQPRNGVPGETVYEGRVYKASAKPPLSGEDF
ncbi:hypothetical protein CRM22_001440 [Opisthorchis felineus]|uniref:Mediator of RNA polymerase II transcription subunit 23 n=1 Tax=Opisthorchis felineus TaxID=147828 RepID=A0A4S2MAM6_OPIFE|nr:hypothetical protein CRM22_001440 [Opisthorchis felineus]